MSGQTLGTFQITIVLADYEGNVSNNAFTITVECVAGS